MKTKLFLVLWALVLSTSTFANDWAGGLLLAYEQGDQFAVKCAKNEETSNKCLEYKIYHSNNSQADFVAVSTLPADKKGLRQFTKRMYKYTIRKRMNRITAFYLAGSAMPLIVCGLSYPSDFLKYVTCPALIVTGFVVDVAKLPISLAHHVLTLPSFAVDRAKSKALINFMLNEKNKGKTKKISSKWVRAIWSSRMQ